jgi:hypothetical protein
MSILFPRQADLIVLGKQRTLSVDPRESTHYCICGSRVGAGLWWAVECRVSSTCVGGRRWHWGSPPSSSCRTSASPHSRSTSTSSMVSTLINATHPISIHQSQTSLYRSLSNWSCVKSSFSSCIFLWPVVGNLNDKSKM